MSYPPYLDEALGLVHPVEDLEAAGVRAAVLVHEAEIPVELVDGEAEGVPGYLAYPRVDLVGDAVRGVRPSRLLDPVLDAGEVRVGELGQPEETYERSPERSSPSASASARATERSCEEAAAFHSS